VDDAVVSAPDPRVALGRLGRDHFCFNARQALRQWFPSSSPPPMRMIIGPFWYGVNDRVNTLGTNRSRF